MEYFVIVTIVGVLPWFIIYMSWRRKRKIAQAECAMAKALLEFERLMLDAVVIDGQVCHDVLYKGMFEAQSKRDYGLNVFGLLKKPSSSQRDAMVRIGNELKNSNDSLRGVLMAFSKAHFQASLSSNHARAISYVLVLFFITGGVLILISALKQLRFAVECVEVISNRVAKIKSDIAEAYLERSLSNQL